MKRNSWCALSLMCGLLTLTTLNVRAAELAKVLALSVKVSGGIPVAGAATEMTCRATPGTGYVLLNNLIDPGIDGATLELSVVSALTALRTDRTLPGGTTVDHKNFDLVFERSERGIFYGQSSGATATAIVAYSAMTGRHLRDRVAVTGDVGIDGQIRPIGGLEWKIPAAIDAGANIIIIPAGNFEEVMRLPYRSRVKVPIFPLATLSQAITCSLAPTDPAARGFNDYLSHRDDAIISLQSFYEDGLRKGDYKEAVTTYMPNLDAVYESYFRTYPQAGGNYDFSDFQRMLQQYPYDVGLRSALQIGKRIRMVRAASEEFARGTKYFDNKEYESAIQHLKQAAELNPDSAEIARALTKANLAQIEVTLRPTIDAAERLYNERKFHDAAVQYHSLAIAAKEISPHFGEMERIANARANAEEHVNDFAAHRLAGDLAKRFARYEDAADEYSKTLELQSTVEHASLYISALSEACANLSPDVAQKKWLGSVAFIHGLAQKMSRQEFASAQASLGAALVKGGLRKDGIAELTAAYSQGKSIAAAEALARAYLSEAAAVKGAEHDALIGKAVEVLENPRPIFYQDEELYSLREELERLRGVDTLFPYLRLDESSGFNPERPVKGTLQLVVYTRSATTMRAVEVTCDGHTSTEVPLQGFQKGQVNVRWDSSKEPDGAHRLDVYAVGVNGKRMRLTFNVTSKNRMLGEVWGDSETGTYHLPTCKQAPVVLRRVILKSEDDALRQKFKPCYRCIK